MNSIFRKDTSADEPTRLSDGDEAAFGEHLARLERLVDSLHEFLGDLKIRELQLSTQMEQQLEWMQRNEVDRSGAGEDAATRDQKSGDRTGQFDDEDGFGDDTGVQDWQRQRQELLNRMEKEDQKQVPQAEAPVAEAQPGKKNMWDESPTLSGETPEDQDEIRLLKEQLKQAIRSAEIELSVERARLSNEKLQLDKKTNDLEQREKDLNRREAIPSATGVTGDKRVGRLRSFLSRRKNT